jgi:periplasmic divalent cation tolerance protein
MPTVTTRDINPISIIYTTVSSLEIAEKLAKNAIESHLAACVNILPNMISYYRWKEKIENSSEVILLFKTTSSHCAALVDWIKKNHLYDVPAILSAEVDVLRDFYTYIQENV